MIRYYEYCSFFGITANYSCARVDMSTRARHRSFLSKSRHLLRPFQNEIFPGIRDYLSFPTVANRASLRYRRLKGEAEKTLFDRPATSDEANYVMFYDVVLEMQNGFNLIVWSKASRPK